MILERLNESDQSVLRRYPRLCPGTMICKASNHYLIRQGHQSLPLQLSLILTIDVEIDNKVAKSD